MSPLPERVPVLVVGAGPTGLAVANLLGQDGIEVLVVERAAATSDLPRAVALDDEGARTLDAVGLMDRVLETTIRAEGMRYYLEDGTCFAAVGAGVGTYGYPKRLYFHQPELEQLLLDGARRFANVRVSFSSTLASFAQSDEAVRCEVETADGVRHRIEADFLLACDGGGSPVRSALGIAMTGETYRQDWIVLDLLEDDDQARFSRFHCDPARPWVSIPAPRGGRRYEFMLLDGEDGKTMLALESLQRLLAPVRPLAPEQIVRKAIYTFHARIAERLRVGRILLLGDAAHMTPPFAGQGMNAGLRDTHNVAWKLAAVLRGHAAPAILDSYERERRGPIWAMIRLAVAMGEVIMPVGPARAGFRDALVEGLRQFPEANDYFLQMRFKPQPRYDGGLFVGLDDPERLEASLVGRMIPQPRVRLDTGRTCRLDEVLGPAFSLIAQDEASTRALARLDHPLWHRLEPSRVSFAGSAVEPGSGVITCAPVEPDLHRPFRTHRDALLLVRPDRYAACAFAPEGAGAVADELVGLLRDYPEEGEGA